MYRFFTLGTNGLNHSLGRRLATTYSVVKFPHECFKLQLPYAPLLLASVDAAAPLLPQLVDFPAGLVVNHDEVVHTVGHHLELQYDVALVLHKQIRKSTSIDTRYLYCLLQFTLFDQR